jgi:hypothetical protein
MNIATKLPAPGQRTDKDWASEEAKVDAVLYTTVRVDRVIATTRWHGVAAAIGETPEWMLEVTALVDIDGELKYQERFPGTVEGYKAALKFHRECVRSLVGGSVWDGGKP